MSGHTPGPWKVAREWVGCQANDQVEIYRVESEDGGLDVKIDSQYFGQDKYDANLIAAAPDLLAALEELVDSRGMDDLEPARKAIARAKGEAE